MITFPNKELHPITFLYLNILEECGELKKTPVLYNRIICGNLTHIQGSTDNLRG